MKSNRGSEMSGPDHDALSITAHMESSKIARKMGLEVGNDVSNASYTYRILSITDSGVKALMIAEHGHFVVTSRVVALDLRQGGWTKLTWAS